MARSLEVVLAHVFCQTLVNNHRKQQQPIPMFSRLGMPTSWSHFGAMNSSKSKVTVAPTLSSMRFQSWTAEQRRRKLRHFSTVIHPQCQQRPSTRSSPSSRRRTFSARVGVGRGRGSGGGAAVVKLRRRGTFYAVRSDGERGCRLDRQRDCRRKRTYNTRLRRRRF